jgi:hypothetical protein
MEFKLTSKYGNVIVIFSDKEHSINKEFEKRLFSGEIEDMYEDDFNDFLDEDDKLYEEYLNKVKDFLIWLETERTGEEICENFNQQFEKSWWTGQIQILKCFDDADYKYYRIKK